MFGVEIREFNPDENAALVRELRATLSKYDFAGGQAQIGNNLEIQHVHRGDIKSLKLQGNDLVIEFGLIKKVQDPSPLLRATVQGRTWVDSLYVEPDIKWVMAEQRPYSIGLGCLESFDVRPIQNVERVTIKFFMLNETVILLPKGSPLLVDLLRLGR